MQNFYFTVLIVAFTLLIIALVGVGILMHKNHDVISIEYPSIQNKCPDNWEVQTDGKCVVNKNNINLGTSSFFGNLIASTPTVPNIIDAIIENNDKKTVTWKQDALRCDKKKWAIQNGIMWDGVSNYNQC